MLKNTRADLWTAVSSGLMLIGALCNPTLATAAASKDFSIVNTENGSVEGTIEKDHRRFLGIPFAAPPVGDLRFVAPQPVKSWHGVRKATHFGHSCPQGTMYTDEDCLYLNVFTPYPLSNKPLPVMVWIYGGAYVMGSAATYPPVKIATEGNVIAVAMNYRVGAFGFLAHPALAAESDASGNYGLLDQQAAITWVKRNARAFGGDPNNITIFGESAGGASVCAQLTSPAMAGQFQKAIIESGPCYMVKPRDVAEAYGQNIASENGCPTTADAAAADCLRKLPVSAFAVPGTEIIGNTGGGSLADPNAFPYTPTTGTSVLPLDPPTALATGQFNHVPVIVGSNHDEMRLFTAVAFDLLKGAPITADQYPSLIQTTYTSNAAAVLSQYPLTSYATPDLAFSALSTDSVFSCPTLSGRQSLAQNGNVTYAYEFADENTSLPVLKRADLAGFPEGLGATHGSEVPFLFPIAYLNPAQKRLSHQMIGYWTHFAETGNPNFSGAPAWPQFDTSQNNLLSLVTDATHVTTDFASDHQCAFWAGLPPQK